MNNLLTALLIAVGVAIIFVIGVQMGIDSAYKRIAKGEVVVVPTEYSYRLEWKK